MHRMNIKIQPDHNYYANRALLDGFFMSGVGLDQWQTKSLSQNLAEKIVLK